jgi:murein DD-endopeptidase MepM/ murein hydrolase activator NlpD
MPVDGLVGRGWGWTKDWDSDRQTYKWVFHQGIDIPADCGSAVIAVAGGVDAICTPEALSGGYGNVVVVDHGLGVKTRYAHNSKLLVCGRSVAEGETIAESGNTGRVDSPRPTGAPCRGGHVHFEILIDNFAVDPEKMFDIRWRVP